MCCAAVAPSLTINEINPATGAILNSFNSPVTGPIGPQGLAVGPNSLFFIEGSSSSTHTLWELNLDTGAVIDSDIIDATLTGSIGGVAYLDGKVFIEKSGTNQLIVWNPVADSAVNTLTVSADLNGGLTGAADLDAIFASNSAGQIFKINPTTGAVLATFMPNLGTLSFGLAYINGELIAARSGTTGTASRISPVSGAVLGSITMAGIGGVGALGGDGLGKTVIEGAHLVSLVQSQIATNVNFGNWLAPPSEIRGSKWNDLNGNGVWDKPTEPGLAGRIIYLDTNGNNALDSTELWTVTAADGSYSFTGLPAGEYIVNEIQQTGWTPTHPIETRPDAERLFVVRGTSTTTPHTIYELNPATGAIINSFLTPNTGTLGIEGLAVGPHSLFYVNGAGTAQHTMWELDLDTGAIIDADVVDTTPTGVIGGLAYLNGKVYIEKSTTNQLLVWDPIADALTATLNIGADLNGGLTGAADLGVLFDFGTSGRIYAINPANGVVLQTLNANVDSLSGLAYVQGKLIGSRTSSSSSAYRIDPVTGQVLGQFTMGGTGTNGGLGGDGETRYPRFAHRITVAPGAIVENVDFGDWIAPPGQIQGFKWNDLDADQVWDSPDEPGLAGWTIFLDTNANGVLDAGEASTTTAADGSYSFTGLAARALRCRRSIASRLDPLRHTAVRDTGSR